MTELEKVLIAKNYSYTKNENNQITVTHNGWVFLNGLTTLEPSTVFNNSGGVELNGLTTLEPSTVFDNSGGVYLNVLTTLEPSTVFNNSGSVYLNGLTDFDAINLGYEKRNIKITKHKTKGLCVSLGCFYGNETESIIAIRLKYGYGSKYEIELINAFKKYK